MSRNNTHFKRLVIAAYRLPFKFTKTKKGYKAIQNAGGLVSAVLALSENFKKENKKSLQEKIIWAGVSENLPENFNRENFQHEDFSILPVKIPGPIKKLYYEGFSNDIIWPLFHYFSSYSVFNEEAFEAYRTANQRFCEEILPILKPGDFLWIHDYQLFMLPALIQKHRPDISVGFFLHIPFPSFEIFRLLPKPWREMIIQGMLGADMVGFHTHDYVQHFIKCVRRTTGYECLQNTIYTPVKLVKADAFPIGIDYDKFHQAASDPKVKAVKKKLEKTLVGRKLIFSVDRLDYSKGLLLRLKGFETFLEHYPEWHGKVVFNMVVVPSRDHIDKYREMRKELEYTVGRINGKYSTLAWRPLIYQYRSLSWDEMAALYHFSDVALITPLRDGMNLVAKEFVACQYEKSGVLILSEMAGAAAELSDALQINPLDDLELASAIHRALTMEPEEKSRRIAQMQKRIAEYDVFTWANDFFDQTNALRIQQKRMNVRFIHRAILREMHDQYHQVSQRFFFLDYDGTLVSYEKNPEYAILKDPVRELLRSLAGDSRNRVVIVSGREMEFLEKQFENIPVSLIAEHGYCIKEPGGIWQLHSQPNPSWKDLVRPILQEYLPRCNGSFIEEKSGSLAWHYRNAEPDFASLRLHELKESLMEIIRKKAGLDIIEGNKVLEVKSGNYDKGQAALSFLKGHSGAFILAAGDDVTDEGLFRAMPPGAFTIRVGIKPSFARFNVSASSVFLKLLKTFTENSGKNFGYPL